MAIRKIITPENPMLRKKAHRVTDFGKNFQTLVDDMIQTMIEAPGVGLAAPQVAVPQRLLVARLPDDEEGQKEYGKLAGVVHVLVNPEIIKTSRTLVEGAEACLSIPGYAGKVDRYESIVVRAQDRKGKEVRIKAHDWLARIFQHEIDHLEGRLYIDIAKEIWEQKPEDEAEGKAVKAE
jgi:peptide deformylase